MSTEQESPFKRHEPLYLKYRPQSLEELVGQEGVFRTLANAIDHNRLSHAYLFTGPRGTGKTSSARILAKSLNCKTAGKPTVTPCQTCSCCVEITTGNSPAVFEIDAASNNSVDDARQLIERAPLKAVGGEFKVYIIDECHMLTKEAFNALLKTIEQPPPGVVFILATTEEHKVLPTIVSRCQRLMFKLINQEALTAHLTSVAEKEGIEIESEAIALIARRSGGGLRDALSNLDQASLLSAPGSPASVSDLLRMLGALHEDVLLRVSKQIAEHEGQAVISSVHELLGEGREPRVVLQELSQHFLSLMKASYLAGGGQDVAALEKLVLGSKDYLAGLMEQQKQFEKAELSQIVEQLNRLDGVCRMSSQPAMQLEVGLLGLCHRHDINLLKDLVERVERLEESIANGSALQNNVAQAPRPLARPAAPAADSGRLRELSGSPPARAAAPAPSSAPAAHPSAAAAPGSEERHNERAPASQLSEQAEPELHGDESGYSESGGNSSESGGSASEFSSDIEYLWQQVLDELQRRHLPTFSLTSTHAFPLAVTNKELTIGVLKETFQKMLESKIDHLNKAAQTVSGQDIIVRIRVSEAANPAPKKASAAARTATSSKERSGADREPNGSPVAVESRGDADDEESEPARKDPHVAARAAAAENDTTMVKEAYKLFEGPGSRRLT